MLTARKIGLNWRSNIRLNSRFNDQARAKRYEANLKEMDELTKEINVSYEFLPFN